MAEVQEKIELSPAVKAHIEQLVAMHTAGIVAAMQQHFDLVVSSMSRLVAEKCAEVTRPKY